MRSAMFVPYRAPLARAFVPLAQQRMKAPVLIFHALVGQIPEGVQRRVMLDIATDPYFLKTIATFTMADGRSYDVKLDPMRLTDGSTGSALIPPEFLAHLCVAI